MEPPDFDAGFPASGPLPLALQLLEDHVCHCVAGALVSGDRAAADEKKKELLAAVERFARVR